MGAQITAQQSGNITLRAGSDLNGTGNLRIGSSATNILRTPVGNIVLAGERVVLGENGNRVERLALGGSLAITVDANGNGGGALSIDHDFTMIKAGGDIMIDSGTAAASSPASSAFRSWPTSTATTSAASMSPAEPRSAPLPGWSRSRAGR